MLQSLVSTMRSQTNRGLFSVDPRVRFVNSTLLVVGNLALVVAVYAAHAAPATGYEVNIYAETPLLYWAGVGVAMLSSLWVLAFATERVPWLGGFGLTALAGLSIPALPLLRGYYFYGLSDPLYHLGWAREIRHGTMSFFDLLYPAAHSFAAIVSVFGGVTVQRGTLLVTFLLTCAFVAFTVLTVWTILPDRVALTVALLSAVLFLPVNHVGFESSFKTYSLAAFLFPFALYFLVTHLRSEERDPTLPGRVSATDVGFLVVGVATIFYHPQVATNVIVFTGAIAAAQFVAKRRFPDTLLARTSPVYGQVVVLTAVFFAWNFQHSALFSLGGGLYETLTGLLAGSEQAGAIVGERAESASEAGTSLTTIFVRLFLLPAGYVLVAVGVVLARLFGRLGDLDHRTAVVVDAFAIAGAVSVVFFLTHFVGNLSSYFFRHVGFSMIFGSIVAVVGIHRTVTNLSDLAPSARRTLKVAGVVLVAVALVLSMAAFFPSPYVSLPTSHVSEQQYRGHAAAFEHASDGAAFAAPRTGPRRYYEARGTYLDPRLRWAVSASEMRSGLRAVRDHDYPTRDFYYLFVTETDRERELVAYRALRYGPEAFESVPEQEGVSRVFTNGEVNAYQVLYSTPEDDGPGE
jgi:hypothetical protein